MGGFKKGHIVSQELREKLIKRMVGNKINLGRRFTEETKRKIGEKSKGRNVGNKHVAWKGENVSYRRLHKWIEITLGKPDTCEHCGRSGLKGRSIHWANKSGEYKRNLEDWLRLCAKCHGLYDSNKRRI